MKNNQSENKIIAKKKGVKKGIVVSAKMDKTIVVAVDIFKTHPKYKKKYRSTKRYKVHDEKNKYQEGDKVFIASTKPLSKDKKYQVIED